MEIDKKKAIAERFRNLRSRSELNQTEVAEKAYMSQSAISAIESGERSIRAEELPTLADVLGTTVHEIVTGEDPRNIQNCEKLLLNSHSVDQLHEMQDHRIGMVLDTLIADWSILEQLFCYMYSDYSVVRFWEHGPENTGYVRDVPVSDLMNGIPQNALAEVKLLEIMEHLKKIREGVHNGKS